ncbi:MAG: hypothetical protein ACNA7W_01280 [Pseudomonadales bacterium]
MPYTLIIDLGRWAAGAGVLCLLAACSNVPLEPRPPDGFDLSGSWVLVPEDSGTPPEPRTLRARGGMLSFITQDFAVLRAQELRIEQGPGSMGIYYDGRDYRDISWGTRRRGLWEVTAGWHEGSLIIRSDASDADASETLALSPDGQRLRVDVQIKSRSENVAVTRVFRRQQNAG